MWIYFADEENVEGVKKILDDFDLLDVTKQIIDHQYELTNKTALMMASYQGHETVVELLLERGAKIEVQDGSLKQTALIMAADKGHERIVKLLLEKGANADVNIRLQAKQAIHEAIEGGHLDVVKIIINKHPELLNAKASYLGTPLKIAKHCGKKDIYDWLKNEKGATSSKGCILQ